MVGRQLQVEPVGGDLARGAHHAGVVDQHVDRAERRGGRGRAAHRRQVGEVHLELLELGGGHLGADGVAGLVEPLRVAAGQDHAGAAAGQLERGVVAEPADRRTGDDDGAAGLVGDVGELPGVGPGAVTGWSRGRRAPGAPSSWSPSTVTRPGSAAQRPPASRMNDSRSMCRVTVGSAGGATPPAAAVRRRSRTRTARCPPCPAPGWCRPARRPSCRARSRGSRRGTPRCAWPARVSMLPGRPTARRTSCSCIQTSSGRLRSSVRQVHGTPPKIGSGFASPSVGGSASSAVCRLVAASRSSLMIASGLASRRLTTPISV